MSHNPFPRLKPKAKRTQPRRTGDRVRLGDMEYQKMRIAAWSRSFGKCECGCGRNALLSKGRPHPEAGEFAHDEHGSRKSDELNRGRWLNWKCHEDSHNAGGKPAPRKPGRRMNQTEALAYWNGIVCFCGGPKVKRWSFCFDCMQKLSPQLRRDVELVLGQEYLKTMAEAEKELLAWKPEEERTA